MPLDEHSRMHQTGHKYPDDVKEARSNRMKGQPQLNHRKLTAEEVLYVKEHYIPKDKEFGCRALARRFNIAHSEISRILNGKHYCDV